MKFCATAIIFSGMSAPDYVILMTMLTDTEEGFLRLEAALSEINDELECGSLVWERNNECVSFCICAA